ncbi:MAG: anti-sigma factor [Marmoricola sp.]
MNDLHPDLTALLRGELSNTMAVAAAEHARECEDCRRDLVDDALGHGLLTRAGRTLGAAARTPTEPVVLPERVEQRLARRPRRSRALLAGAAAVALVAVGVGAGLGARSLLVGADRPGPAVAAERTATLEPVEGSASGKVSMGTDHAITRMRMTTKSLPAAPRGEFYYAWLFDPRTNKMLPLGLVTPGRPVTFQVPESLVASYSAVDVSLEADDGDPAHSVTSVLRATYAARPKASS